MGHRGAGPKNAKQAGNHENQEQGVAAREFRRKIGRQQTQGVIMQIDSSPAIDA
jgi:hypothetical protein